MSTKKRFTGAQDQFLQELADAATPQGTAVDRFTERWPAPAGLAADGLQRPIPDADDIRAHRDWALGGYKKRRRKTIAEQDRHFDAARRTETGEPRQEYAGFVGDPLPPVSVPLGQLTAPPSAQTPRAPATETIRGVGPAPAPLPPIKSWPGPLEGPAEMARRVLARQDQLSYSEPDLRPLAEHVLALVATIHGLLVDAPAPKDDESDVARLTTAALAMQRSLETLAAQLGDQLAQRDAVIDTQRRYIAHLERSVGAAQ